MKSLQWMAACLSFLLWAGPPGSSAQSGNGSGQEKGGGASNAGLTIQTADGFLVTKGQPYSADEVREWSQVLADGNRIHKETHSKVFRDSEGRERNEREFYIGGVKGTSVTIFDPVARITIILDRQDKTASVHHFSAPPPSAVDHVVTYPPPAAGVIRDNLGTTYEDLGSKEIDGMVAFGTLETRIVGNEKPFTSVRELWVSHELDVILLKTDESPYGQSITRLINIQRGRPDARLFQIPSDYTLKDDPWQDHTRKGIPWR